MKYVKVQILLAAISGFMYGSLPGLSHSADEANPQTSRALVGQWLLQGDVRDHSSEKNHGREFGESCLQGNFNGRSDYIEIPASSSLQLGKDDFTISVWIRANRELADVPGDIVSSYDPKVRRGFHLGLKASSGGYGSRSEEQHIFFGLDDGREPIWIDCGRPNETSNYVSNALTVFDGNLYAATTDAAEEKDWCHVYRYMPPDGWVDCGRVGDRKTRGVGSMIVHEGSLYAATWNYDWTRVGLNRPDRPVYEADFCRVYRYTGNTQWEDCGQPGTCRRLFGIASYRGKLYVAGDDGNCYVQANEKSWIVSSNVGRYAHPLCVHDGRLFAGTLDPADVYTFDGSLWKSLGNPHANPKEGTQIHDIEFFRGRMHLTTWPLGHVWRLDTDDRWTDLGRLGDATEINAITVYNGKLYGGTIPRAEVFRYDEDGMWTSLRRFGQPASEPFTTSKQWSRVTSLTIFDGKLFGSLGSCTSSHLDAPADYRGRVVAMTAGQCVTYDRDIGTGWKHLAAVRRGTELELYLNGYLVSNSKSQEVLDLSHKQPWRIGFGEAEYFSGNMRDVRIYREAKSAESIKQLVSTVPR